MHYVKRDNSSRVVLYVATMKLRTNLLRRALIVAAAILVAAWNLLPTVSAATAAGTTTTNNSPTPKQIATQLKAVERSSALWATINSCQRGSDKQALIGVRGQMPAPDFQVRLEMVLTAYYYSASKHQYLLVQGSSRTLHLGLLTGGTIQAGIAYTITAPVTVTGRVTFRWYRDGKLLGSVTRKTTAGHKGVQDSTPSKYSVAACTVKS
jgi:hypothetical protein